MRVQLRMFFHFDPTDLLDSGQVELPQGATVREMLRLVDAMSENRLRLVDQDSGMLDASYFLLLNGKDLVSSEDLENLLGDGDEVGIGTNYFWGAG